MLVMIATTLAGDIGVDVFCEVLVMIATTLVADRVLTVNCL